MRAVVLTFDRLPTRFLGCYGSEEADTPHFDRLAAESVVFDFHFCENVDPAAAGHAWWTGRCQFPHPPEVQRGFPPVTAELARAGVRTVLVTEPHEAAVPPPPFAETIDVSGRDGFDAAEDETPFARLVAAAGQQIEQLAASGAPPWLVWLRSRGVPRPWIPPRPSLIEALERAGFLDEAEDDDETSETLASDVDVIISTLIERLAAPERLRHEVGDPGEFETLVETARTVYAGYVTLLDRGLGRLRTAIERAAGKEPLLFIVTAAQGQSLGETVRLGERPSEAERGSRLIEDRIHTPLLIQIHPGALTGRSSALVQTVDLAPTLLDWFGLPPAALGGDGRSLLPLARGEPVERRELVCLGDGLRQAAIRTAEFLLVADHVRRDRLHAAEGAESGHEEHPPRLYVEPDDRWEINDVAAQSSEDVTRLEALLAGFVSRQLVPGGAAQDDPPATTGRT